MKRTQQLNVNQVKMAVLDFARRHDTPTDVLVLALAEVVGLTAATLDAHTGYVPLDERLEEFMAHVRTTYTQHSVARQMLRASTLPEQVKQAQS